MILGGCCDKGMRWCAEHELQEGGARSVKVIAF